VDDDTPAAERLPTHVAIIMDGNGRWATEQGKPRSLGHQAGAEAVRKVVTRARERGVKYLTLYAFSSQNWSRPKSEIRELMSLLITFCHQERTLLMDKDIRFRIIGERSRVPRTARVASEFLEKATKKNDSMQLIIALSYGGREEIVEAARAIAEEVAAGELKPSEITADSFSEHLWTADVPDPDLVIRTSGELRVSNFLLWQIAYSEIVIDDCYWPDFDGDAFDNALAVYASRERRFGGVRPKA
jgi:undecaprenyl diphosphate synthase